MPLEPHLPQGLEFNTYWAQAAHKREPDNAGKSRIDHFLIKNGSAVEANSFTLYIGPHWEQLSDHRPLLCWLAGPAFIQLDQDGQKPRPPPCAVRKHGLKKEDNKTVDAYITELRKLNTEDKLGETKDPVQAAKT